MGFGEGHTLDVEFRPVNTCSGLVKHHNNIAIVHTYSNAQTDILSISRRIEISGLLNGLPTSGLCTCSRHIYLPWWEYDTSGIVREKSLEFALNPSLV